jgi:hypothetical protein
MKTLLNTATLCVASFALISCGGDPAATPEAPVLLSASSKSTAQQQAVVSDYYNVVQKIYVGYFGRPADPGGLAFFSERFLSLQAPTAINQMGDAYAANAAIRSLIDVFGTSAESAALYPGDNGTFMDAVYRNLFGREADPAGKAFWVGQLDKGNVTRANAAVNIMAGAQGTDVDIVNKKTAVATYFTGALVTPTQQLAYSGLEANVGVRQMLGTVTATTDTTAFQATVDGAIANLVKNLSPFGMYFGKLGGGQTQFNSLVLENGQYYGFYSQAATGRFAPTGFLQGPSTTSGADFVSSDVRDFNPEPYAALTLTATYAAQSKLDGSVNTPNGPIPFTSTGPDPKLYSFNVPAVAADLAGTWVMTDNENKTYSMPGPVNNVVAGIGAACTFSGSMAPRAGGKNLFDASLTYAAVGGNTCRMAGKTATGIAFSMLADEGSTRQLFIAATTADRVLGTMLSGNRVTPDGMAPALTITDTVVGTGAVAGKGNIVTVHYTGFLYNAKNPGLRSTRFESSLDRGAPFSFLLGAGGVIAGWDQGVVGMRVGGKRTLVIPASLGYGVSGSGSTILPNASMVFDIEMTAVK